MEYWGKWFIFFFFFFIVWKLCSDEGQSYQTNRNINGITFYRGQAINVRLPRINRSKTLKNPDQIHPNATWGDDKRTREGKKLRIFRGGIPSVSRVDECLLLGLCFFIRGVDWSSPALRAAPLHHSKHTRGLSAALESGRAHAVCFGMKKGMSLVFVNCG